MSGEKNILDYAKGPPRWRKWIWHAVFSLAILLIAASVWRFWEPASFYCRAYYWKRACLTYQLPPTEVVWETDPQAVDLLLKSKPQEYLEKWLFRWNPEFHPEITHLAVRREDIVFTMEALWTGPSVAGSDVPNIDIFLHERTSRGIGGGKSRLVEVRFYLQYDDPRTFQDLLTIRRVSEMGPTTSRPRNVAAFSRFSPHFSYRPRVIEDPRDPPPNLRIYAGQPDPNDPSHFTFDYEQWGQRDTVDGWLEADDSVTLKPRPPPTPPTPPTAP
jgi:hypothetical protein